MLRIAHPAQDGGYHVVAVDEDDAPYAGDAVAFRVFDDVLRCIEPGYDALIAEQEDDHDDDRETHQQGKQRADQLTYPVVPFFPDRAGNQDLPGVGEAHGDEGDQHEHLAADGHGGKPLCADETADYHHIHHIVHHLEQPG